MEFNQNLQLYGIFRNRKFRLKSEYAWRDNNNPWWVWDCLNRTYELTKTNDLEEMIPKLKNMVTSSFVATYERITLAMTFDRVVVFKNDMRSVAGALREFDRFYNGNFLTAISKGILELYKNNKCQAFAFNLSDVENQWKDYCLPEVKDGSYLTVQEILSWSDKPLPLFT